MRECSQLRGIARSLTATAVSSSAVVQPESRRATCRRPRSSRVWAARLCTLETRLRRAGARKRVCGRRNVADVVGTTQLGALAVVLVWLVILGSSKCRVAVLLS